MKDWTDDELRAAIGSIPPSATEQQAISLVTGFARSRAFRENPGHDVWPGARGVAVAGAAVLLVGFALVNLNLIAARHAHREVNPGATAVTTPASPTASPGLKQDLVYSGGALALSRPGPSAEPTLDYRTAAAACTRSGGCPQQSARPVIARLALASSNAGLGSGPERTRPGDKVLAWAQIWTDVCPSTGGPALATPAGSPVAPAGTCEFVLLIDAGTGRYVGEVSTNRVQLAATGAPAPRATEATR